VTEPRTYTPWGEKGISLNTGIVCGRKALNELHDFLGKNGYNEVYVDQMDYDVVAITRHRPLTHESVIMVVHTAFSGNMNPNAVRHVKPVCVEGLLEEVILEARLLPCGEQKAFTKDTTFINGMTSHVTHLKQHIHISESQIGRMAASHGDKPQQKTIIELFNLLPGSIITLKFRLFDEQSKASADTRALVKALENMDSGQDIFRIANDLTLLDLNSVLFQCDQEERDLNSGNGVYSLNGYGPLKYAGLQGVMSILSEIRPKNDLGNWLPDNLRQGDWLMVGSITVYPLQLSKLDVFR
jgi:glycogen debranching enzyme